jgi:hypothetical protein
MKNTYIYLSVIALLMYIPYAIQHDRYKEQQQEAQVHHEYCTSFPQKCR